MNKLSSQKLTHYIVLESIYRLKKFNRFYELWDSLVTSEKLRFSEVSSDSKSHYKNRMLEDEVR